MLTLLAQLEMNWAQWITPFTERWWQETTCSVLVGIACGVLGCFVVLRRMALIGDALSHSVLPGVVIAFILHHMVSPNTTEVGVPSLLLGALIAGLLTAVLINVVSRYSRTKEDSAIGIVFTAFFALGIILISNLPRGTHFDLKCFLFGDPLAVKQADLILMAIICPLVMFIIALLYHPLKLSSFDPVLAAAMGLPVALLHYLLMGMLSATVVAGLKTTGVVLVVAMVITPASAAYQFANRFSVMLLLSGIFGGVSAAVGMSLAFVTNSPTGPTMVLVAATIFVFSMLLSPSHGVIFDRVRRLRLRGHFQSEDILKGIYKLNEQTGQCSPIQLSKLINLPVGRLGSLLTKLTSQGLVTQARDHLQLTDAGEHRAAEMVRAHRLWETYLADRVKLQGDELHDQAEKLEHAHDLADEIDAQMGFPKVDPHGEKIPGKPGI